MLSDIKNTIKQSAIYGLSRIATRAASFILIPIYTAKFSSDSIANINLLESFWQYLFTICMFAVETAIINFCLTVDKQDERKRIIFNFLAILVINSIILFSLSMIYSRQISIYILKDGALATPIFYCFLISIFESLLILPMTIARLNNKPLLYSIIAVSNLAINLVLQIYFILVIKLDFQYVFLAKVIAPAIIFAICIPYLVKFISIHIDFAAMKKILAFCFPLMIAMLLSLLLNSVDRFILTDYVSKEQIAIYTIGYSIGSVTNAFILAPYSLAINVIFWNKINDVNFRRYMTKSSTYLFFAMTISALIISLFINYAMKIFVRNDQLWPATNIIPVVLLSNCFMAMFTFPSLDYYFKRKTNIILYIIIICLVFRVVTNFIFIPMYGIYASTFLTLLSYVLLMILSYSLVRKTTFTKFEFYKIWLLTVSYCLFVSVMFFIKIQNPYLDITLKLALIMFYLIILYLFRFFEPVELQRVKELVFKFSKKHKNL